MEARATIPVLRVRRGSPLAKAAVAAVRRPPRELGRYLEGQVNDAMGRTTDRLYQDSLIDREERQALEDLRRRVTDTLVAGIPEKLAGRKLPKDFW